MSTINVGDIAHLTAKFLVAGALADPDTVTVRVRKPDGTLVSGAAVHDTTGTYHYDVDVDQPGPWRFAFMGVGTVQAAEDGTFSVPNPRT